VPLDSSLLPQEDILPGVFKDRRNPAHRPRASWTSHQLKQCFVIVHDLAALSGIIVDLLIHMYYAAGSPVSSTKLRTMSSFPSVTVLRCTYLIAFPRCGASQNFPV
jgi:hypothetical protein